MSKHTTFRSRSSDHVPVVPTMVSSNPVGVKRIHVFRNGDVFYPGIQVVVNTHRVPSMDVLLDVVSERIGLVNGAKKMYTTSGTIVKDVNKISDGENYVASSSHFTPMAYGGQTIQKNDEKAKKKKKVKRSKTVDGRKKKVKEEEEIVIPFNGERREEEEHKEEKKKKKKKKVVSRKEEGHHPDHHGSIETLAETAEVELPSEVDDSEEEDAHHHRPSTRHTMLPPSRSASRKGSLRDEHEEEEKKEKKEKKEEKEGKRRKSVSTRRKSVKQTSGSSPQQPNWGDLSSFTKNIESLLRN